MRFKIVASTTLRRGFRTPPRASRCTVFATIYALLCSVALADSVAINPDPPARSKPPSVGPAHFRSEADTNGIYLWLAPVGAMTHADGAWDSTFGGDLAIVRIREREPLSVIGFDTGAALWTERGGGRIWFDVVAGTKLLGKNVGLTAGPILELGDLQHPRKGASIGAWAFLGITPFARVGSVEELGTFVDVGIHIALPVYRH